MNECAKIIHSLRELDLAMADLFVYVLESNVEG